ncbi:hypothetical protein JNB62_14740 [Microbacterium jejuense]|uniref:Lipoprotein n=1 Tax=Microbacterium jejuense TaxID=1263637 RepID=A0ABS7HSD4_9MICO|nr:hypothetical protein [Microbacterium jejuense]MBW9094944.1 hypothetical protein [Microbacterium jejuense]
MAVRSRSLVAGVGLMVLAAGVLAACATPAGSGTASTPKPTSSASASGGSGGELEVDAAWVDGGRMIALVTEGSSSTDCIPVAGETSYANGVLEVELVAPPEATVCTADYVPRATLVGVPEGVDPTQDLEIRLTGEYTGDTDLDGVAGLTAGGSTDYLPSAGWADDGQFVIVTWGSSTCVPVISEVAATSSTEVTVTFATPPADQACTMDMVPRATVAQVTTELDDDGEVFAILTGAEFDNVRIPIIGHD